MANCCQPKQQPRRSFFLGLLYGLIPHTFCLAFIVLSIIGATSATMIVKKFLLIPYFFPLLIVVSLLFATATAWFYLKRNNYCSRLGIKNRWRYLTTLYTTTIMINLLIIYVVFPAAANLQTKSINNAKGRTISINVQLPCSGHAPLVIDEVEKITGVEAIKFEQPQTFKITYDPKTTSPEKIAALEIFKTFKLKFN